MSVWSRRNQSGEGNEYDDLLVFGYSSKLFVNDEAADNIAEERHMVPCLGDSTNRVDRYDCRLLLASVDNLTNGNVNDDDEECPTEAMEEHMCEEERYIDLYKDMQVQRDKEEEARKRQFSTIGFEYGTSVVNNEEEDSDSEDEPFEAPEGIKFPVGLQLPSNMKLNHIIEKTASFVVSNGAQMEIVIKAKQRNNSEQFGFLDFDHPLYPFYKYIQKLIREKKYTPNIGARKKQQTGPSTSTAPILNGSLAAIAQEHLSDSDGSLSDDDSDCELHPSLLSGAKRAASPEKVGVIGPRFKPKTDENIVKQSFDITKGSNVYASLFKNLSHVTKQASGITEEQKTETEAPQQKPEAQNSQPPKTENRDNRVDDPEYREWFQLFYHQPCPWIGPRPMLPPTPDLEPILNSYAEHVARKGVEFERSLIGRPDLQLHFMDPNSPYYSYYHHKIRMFQWQMTQEYNSYNQNQVKPIPQSRPLSNDLITPNYLADVDPGPSTVDPTFYDAPMNRRQRRRLVESSKAFGDSVAIQEPGVIDPIALKTEASKMKPDNANFSGLSPKPVSFTLLSKGSDDVKPTSNSILNKESEILEFDPDAADVSKGSAPKTGGNPAILGLQPPAPPSIPNNTQLDRKEKARIFMEKLLQEKRIKKQQEDEERMKLEMDALKKAEKITEYMNDSKTRNSKESTPLKEITGERPSVSAIDQIINSRISSLLSESGFAEDRNRDDDDKKKRKRHKKRSRSRSRSRSPDSRSSRKDKRKRSRSRSRDHRYSSRSSSHSNHR